MKVLSKTWKYIKNNKLKCAGLVALELIFIISFIILIATYMPNISEHIIQFNLILEQTGANDIGAITALGERADEIKILHESLQILVAQLIIGIIIVSNIIYGFFFSLVLKKIKSWYMAKFIGVNVLIQLFLWLIYGIVVKVKGSSVPSNILDSGSRTSMFIFVLICYVIYFFALIYFVKIGKDSIKNTKKFIVKKGWITFGLYAMLMIGMWIVLIASQILVFIDGWAYLIIVGLIILATYRAYSKLVLIQAIE